MRDPSTPTPADGPRDRPETEHSAREDVDAEDVVEDAAELFGAEHRGAPISDTDVPPPG